MASSRVSSNGPDWKDVAGNLVAFEAINGVRLEVRMSTADYHGRADIAITVVAHDPRKDMGMDSALCSASVRCSGIRLKSLEGLLIHALYILDGKLGEAEWSKLVLSAEPHPAH